MLTPFTVKSSFHATTVASPSGPMRIVHFAPSTAFVAT